MIKSTVNYTESPPVQRLVTEGEGARERETGIETERKREERSRGDRKGLEL